MGRFLKTLFGVLILVWFIWFCMIGSLEPGETKANARPSRKHSRSLGSLKHMKVTGVDKLHVHPNSDLNYMSKRRVPNGPDPIHNRRAGNSRRPPGRA